MRLRQHGSPMNTPKRRLLDLIGAGPTYVAAGARITGDFEAPGALVMCGHVRGDGDVKGPLSLAETARWDGEVHAQSGVIAGTINGAIRVDGKIEIRASAVIHGAVTARTIAIAKGAIVEGEVTVTSGEPIVNFEEKRKR